VLATLSDLELVEKFLALDKTINLLKLLGGISVIRATSNIKNNVVLRFAKNGGLSIHPFINLERATEGYFDLEKTYPEDDIVLVRAKTFHDIQSAYRNYFQNTEDFVKYVMDGVKVLYERAKKSYQVSPSVGK
jgi:putative GTP pyrophosphokinase